MANSKSAIKRIKTNERNRLQNRFYKSSIRTVTKSFLQQLETYKLSQKNTDKEKAETLLKLIYKLIDKSTKKSIYHKNTAARKKSNLAFQLKQSVL